jgi:Na+/proline symporter
MKTEWTYLLIAGFAWWWLAARLDRLGKQLEAVSYLVRVERRFRTSCG